jgi:Uncharacterized protein, homolog of Cu resistance protein CopC
MVLFLSPPQPQFSRTGRLTSVSRIGGAAAALILVLAGPAGPAAAHSQLVGSTPATGAHVSKPPAQVKFTFNQDISTRFATTALSVDDAASRQLPSRV